MLVRLVIVAELASQEEELAMVALRGADAVDPSGLTARELLQLVRLHGPRTVQRTRAEREAGADQLLRAGPVRSPHDPHDRLAALGEA